MINETWISRNEIPKAVQRITGGARKPHHATIARWYGRGVKGVRLEVHRVGGQVFTTERMLREFFAATGQAGQQRQRRRKPRVVARTVSPSQADAMLAARGF